MFYAKLKVAAAILLAVSVGASATGVALWQARAEEAPKANPQADAVRLAQAKLVARVMLKPGHESAVGIKRTAYTLLTIASVLKDETGKEHKRGDILRFRYDFRDALPKGEFTAYLVPHEDKAQVFKGYHFIGEVAAGSLAPGTKDGVSHVEGEVKRADGAEAPKAAQPAASANSIAECIAQLGSEDFAAREAATKRLIEIGEPARTAVERAAGGGEVEVSARAKRVLRELDARAQPVRKPAVDVRLRISNQSQRLQAADIRVTIDDKEIVAKVFHVGMGHNFESIVTPLTEGEHALIVESKAGAVKQEMRIRISKQKRWIDILFWSPPSKFTIELCDQDRPTL